jgi:hypothetical protein
VFNSVVFPNPDLVGSGTERYNFLEITGTNSELNSDLFDIIVVDYKHISSAKALRTNLKAVTNGAVKFMYRTKNVVCLCRQGANERSEMLEIEKIPVHRSLLK